MLADRNADDQIGARRFKSWRLGLGPWIGLIVDMRAEPYERDSARERKQLQELVAAHRAPDLAGPAGTKEAPALPVGCKEMDHYRDGGAVVDEVRAGAMGLRGVCKQTVHRARCPLARQGKTTSR